MKPYFIHLAAVAILTLGVSGCHSGGVAVTDDDSESLRRDGYAPAPQITAVTLAGANFSIIGQATGDGRVKFNYSGRNSAGQVVKSIIGLTADSKGRFKAAVPYGPTGGLYDLLMEDRGRLMHAEGRLFVPPGDPSKAIILKPGGASQLLTTDHDILGVVDYDSAGGLALAGQTGPRQTVHFLVNGVPVGWADSDDTGRYHLITQIPAPTATPTQIAIDIQTGTEHTQRTISVSLPQVGDEMTRLADGWRVDWILPGGGIQTTLVF